MPDSTSPDDLTSVSPPLMTTFVVPTAYARQVATLLQGWGLTVGHHPAVPDEATFVAVPDRAVVDNLSGVSDRFVRKSHDPFHPTVFVDNTVEVIGSPEPESPS